MTETATPSDIDPVTLEVLWSRIRSIPNEMGERIKNTAYSPVIKYSQDFSTALFTWDGRMISQGVYTPGHLGSIPIAMQKILDDYYAPEEWRPGDVVTTNNPYINSGHLPDFSTFEPVFVDGSLVGFCATIAHHTDVGGVVPGSYTMEARDRYVEGIQVRPTPIVEEGELNSEVLELVVDNSRSPKQMRGDFDAQLTASRFGVNLFETLIEEYGIETFQTYAEEIIDRSARTTREAIRELPDGTHSNEDYVGGFDEELKIRVTVTVDGDELHVDFSGTADQATETAINSVWNYTFAYTIYAIKAAIDSDTPPTHGMVEPITMEAPDDSLVNPSPPSPVGSRHILSDRVVSAITGALHEFETGLVPASGSQDHVQVMEFSDTNNGDDIFQDVFYGGAGARPDRDGNPAVSGVSNVSNTPVEAVETSFPIRISEYRFVQDSCGHGEYRGGPGTVRRYEFLQRTNLQTINERFEYGPHGLEGGTDGATGKAVLESTDQQQSLSPKDECVVEAGDTLSIYTSGGGGYGKPTDRSRERVLQDLENGIISEQTAREVYDVDL